MFQEALSKLLLRHMEELKAVSWAGPGELVTLLARHYQELGQLVIRGR